MKTIRISELPLVGSLKGLFSIGVDKDSRSVRFSLQTVEEAIAAKQDKGDYALKSELPDISNLAKKSEIPDISGLATKSEVSRVEGQAATNAANILKKVDKVDGKGLSTNDYTDSDKDKVGKALTEHQSLANYYTKEEVDSKVAQGGTFDPTSYYNKRDIDDLMEGKADADTAVLSYDASWVLGLVKTGGTVSEEQFAAISAAVEAGSLVTLADSGVAYQAAASLEENASASLGAVINLLCPAYNTSLALYRIAKDRTIYVTKFALALDTELNATSRNAVINSAVTAALADKQDKGNYVKATELSAVAKTGSYNDLTDKPSVSSSRMTVNSVAAATKLNLQLALNNIYELAGGDYASMTFTLPSVAPAITDRDREIVIRFSVGTVIPTLTFSSALPLKLADGDSLTSVKAGTDYEISIIYTAAGWHIVCQSFAELTEG